MSTVIRIEGLSKQFHKNIVLDKLDLSIEERSICAIIGQSGTGKSVLLKTILGMITPDAGRVWYRDTELTALSREESVAMRRHFGYAFQNAALFDSMTVGENMAFPLREVLGIRDRKEISRRIKKLLDWIELPGIEKASTEELSGGMRKRIGVARALIMEPDVLFFDEPTTGLDPVLSETINSLVVRVNKELGVSCILISHDIPAVFRMADKIAFLDKGLVVAEGSPEEVSTSSHPMVQEFLRIAFDMPENVTRMQK